jgi:hypothetical protein
MDVRGLVRSRSEIAYRPPRRQVGLDLDVDGMNSVVRIVGSMMAQTARASWTGTPPVRSFTGCVAS